MFNFYISDELRFILGGIFGILTLINFNLVIILGYDLIDTIMDEYEKMNVTEIKLKGLVDLIHRELGW